jgi:hypothetical protein
VGTWCASQLCARGRRSPRQSAARNQIDLQRKRRAGIYAHHADRAGRQNSGTHRCHDSEGLTARGARLDRRDARPRRLHGPMAVRGKGRASGSRQLQVHDRAGCADRQRRAGWCRGHRRHHRYASSSADVDSGQPRSRCVRRRITAVCRHPMVHVRRGFWNRRCRGVQVRRLSVE